MKTQRFWVWRQRRGILTILFIVCAVGVTVGPTQALSGVVGRSIDLLLTMNAPNATGGNLHPAAAPRPVPAVSTALGHQVVTAIATHLSGVASWAGSLPSFALSSVLPTEQFDRGLSNNAGGSGSPSSSGGTSGSVGGAGGGGAGGGGAGGGGGGAGGGGGSTANQESGMLSVDDIAELGTGLIEPVDLAVDSFLSSTLSSTVTEPLDSHSSPFDDSPALSAAPAGVAGIDSLPADVLLRHDSALPPSGVGAVASADAPVTGILSTPEPSSLALLALGLFGAALRGYRRRSRTVSRAPSVAHSIATVRG